ncbi:hypothetical protein G9A89_002260 [Geosiphon pyriformis]|nr:hypothetical protein G9A89_002260 [Geosiphon pyriformis]
MNEKSYIRLNALEDGCQFCRIQHPVLIKVYWAFRVRACKTCITVRTKGHNELLNIDKIPEYILNSLPYIGPYSTRLYWRSEVKSVWQEYSRLKCEEDKHDWLVEKKLDTSHRMTETTLREDTAMEQEWNKSWDFVHNRLRDVLRRLNEQLRLVEELASSRLSTNDEV